MNSPMRNIRLAYPSCVKSHFKNVPYMSFNLVMLMSFEVITMDYSLSRACLLGFITKQVQTCCLRFGDAKSNRGWDQTMYDSLTLLHSTHKLLTLSSSQHLHCDSVCVLHGTTTKSLVAIKSIRPKQAIYPSAEQVPSQLNSCEISPTILAQSIPNNVPCVQKFLSRMRTSYVLFFLSEAVVVEVLQYHHYSLEGRKKCSQ